ncbi:hypothetical protein [Labedaea rhizosphaerae]|uniref:hypothetical protein n=1 Tax=Labedaea rhizosphaerae TaxID=598644 RepID=UPI00105B24CD|nr:hypothetical protein [Labedaea rhizosphaerae]
MARFRTGKLLRTINGTTTVDTSWLDPATITIQHVARLEGLIDDFTGADLRAADLTGLNLVGVRWSRSATAMTLWPPGDIDWIMNAPTRSSRCGIVGLVVVADPRCQHAEPSILQQSFLRNVFLWGILINQRTVGR